MYQPWCSIWSWPKCKTRYLKVRKYYHKACNINDGYGCLYLGNIYYKGLGVKKDISKTQKYFLKSYNLNVRQGCTAYKLIKKRGY